MFIIVRDLLVESGPNSSRDSAAPNLPSIEVLGVDFLGPTALATLISAVEMGIVIACFMRFLARSDKEPLHIKLLVFFLTFVSLCVVFLFDSALSNSYACHACRFQTILTSAAWWKIFVQDFGKWVRFSGCFVYGPNMSFISIGTRERLRYLPGHRKFILLWYAAFCADFACHFEPLAVLRRRSWPLTFSYFLSGDVGTWVFRTVKQTLLSQHAFCRSL
jgi:hypothetical protein